MGRKKISRSDRELIQAYWFEAIIYEGEANEFRLNRLNEFWDEFFYIVHDRDVITELDRDEWCIEHDIHCDSNLAELGIDGYPVVGTLKKPHIHAIGYTKNPCILARAAIKFDIPSNRVQKVENRKKAIRYLVHADYPHKTQYRIEEVVTNNSALLSKMLDGDGLTVTDKARIILETLETCYDMSMLQICTQMIQNGVYDEFRRGQHLYTSIIIELRNQNKPKTKKEYE